MSEDLTKNPQSADEKLTLILATVQAASVRVDDLEQTVKVALYDLQPILRRVVADVAQLREGQQRLEGRFGLLEDRFGQLEGRFGHLEHRVGSLEEGQESLRSELRSLRRHVDYRFLMLSGTVEATYRKLEQRVTLLELNSNPPNSQT